MCPSFCTSWLADWALLVPPSLTCLEDLLSLFSTLSKAPLGYLHLVRAFRGDPFLVGATQDCCTQWRPYGRGTTPQGKDSCGSWRHYPPIGVLSQEHLLFFPRPVLWTGWGCCHGFPSQPHCGQPIHGVLGTKSSKYCPHPQVLAQVCGRHLCHPQEANKQGFLQNINSVDPAIRFTVEDNKEDGSIPFLDTFVKPGWWLSVHNCIQETPHILTSIYSGTATITSQPSLVSSKPSPIGPPQCAAILSCSNKKRITSGRLSPSANILRGLWTRWRKDLTGLPDRSVMGALTMPSLPTMKCKTRGTLSYPTHKVFVKVSKRSVVGTASKHTSKVAEPSKPYWSPPRTKTYGQPKWCHLLVPMWGPRLWWWVHRGNLQDLWWKIQRAPEAPLCHSSPQQPTGHTTNQNNFQIIGREGHNLARNIKESIYIRVNNPTLNNNIGKFNLSHIWERVLLNTKGLTLNNQSNNNNN